MTSKFEIRVPHTIERLGKEERYKQIIETFRSLFEGTSLLNSNQQISQSDLGRISLAFNQVSPLNVESQAAIQSEKTKKHPLIDPSIFNNWEDIGGPQEHMDLVMKGAGIITELVQANLKSPDSAKNKREEEAIREVNGIEPYHAAAAGALHDVGRELTHIFYSNDLFGSSILRKVGVREDIIKVHPSEDVMQAPLGTMLDVIRSLPAEAVIIRIADEFSKRAGSANRILQLEDFDPISQEEWGRRYTGRPSSGLASDNWFRRHIARHNANASEYFEALNKWCLDMTDRPLWYYASRLSVKLSEFMPRLSKSDLTENVISSSESLSDGEVLHQTIEIGDQKVLLKAVKQIGGPNKRFNEDGFLIRGWSGGLDVVVVDGGTQIEQVPSLDDKSGGKYIAEKVLQFSSLLSPKTNASQSLLSINVMIRDDMETNHPDIKFSPDSKSIPYGCVAYVKVDTKQSTIEIANAGDVFVVAVGSNGESSLLSFDDVSPYDQMSFQRAREVAVKNGVSVRLAIEHAMKQDDQRFRPILDQMLVAMKASNLGEVERIMGLDNLKPHSASVPIDEIDKIIIGSDGAVPIGFDIHTHQGLRDYISLIDQVGVEGIRKEIETAARADPDFESHPRFRNIDDMTLIALEFHKKDVA